MPRSLSTQEILDIFLAVLGVPAPMVQLCKLYWAGKACWERTSQRLPAMANARRHVMYALGLVVVLAGLLFLIPLLGRPISVAIQSIPTPYSLMEVTISWTPGKITDTYNNWIGLAHGEQDDAVRGTSQPATHKNEFAALTDPLQQCVYHRDNIISDWYSVPEYCPGELAVDGLQTLKAVVRKTKHSDDSFERMYAALHRLQGRLEHTIGVHAWSFPAASSQSFSITEKSIWARVRLWEVVVEEGWRCSHSFKSRVQGAHSLLFSSFLCVNWRDWFKTQTEIISRSVLHYVAAAKHRAVLVPFAADSESAL
ncbi:hypothetical protein N658DRAFT_543130 [Parathielavia hyrcaniae]|uniref:Uncharacterized protein n=1 Tax=Parathielavia hyrcaniae TaxID=113614 RepID=A0AAN6PVT0_9PEZI|nr:hypothetical protein N658DRAFT_543130 [Parathielavia hyrcaniae]